MTVDKELLLKSALPEVDVDIPSSGITVRVRALTRHEAMSCQQVKDGPDRAEAIERKMLALAMIDPELTEAEVGKWQKGSPAGDIEPVTNEVLRISGMRKGADKEAYKGFDDDPDAEFRVPPS